MRNNLIGWAPQPGGPLVEALASMSQLQPSIPELMLFYGPVARMNPYQALLYSSFAKEGIAVAEVLPIENFKEISKTVGMAKRTAVHFHWISFVLHGASSKENAEWRVGKFLSEVDELKKVGVLVIFTIHNKVPHDARYPDEELLLQQGLIDRADVVHNMSHSAMNSMEGYATIPESKCVVAPHPLYDRVYPDFLSKSECRRMLGIQPDEFVVSLFGAIKPYKGIVELKDNWRRISSELEGPVRLVIAGANDGSPESDDFVDWAFAQPDVIVEIKKIPFEQVQIFVKSADVGLIPYDRTLNSGAAMLHLTFGVPIICKNEPAILEGLPHDLAYPFAEFHELPRIIQQVRAHLRKGTLEESVKSLRESRDAEVVSRAFARELKKLLNVDEKNHSK